MEPDDDEASDFDWRRGDTADKARNCGMEERLVQMRQLEVHLLMARDASNRRRGQCLWYCRSLSELFWRTGRELYKVNEMEEEIKKYHQRIWPFMQAPSIEKTHGTTSGVQVLASTLPTSGVFALGLAIFSNPKRHPEDRRVFEHLLRFWVNKMAGEEVIVMQFAADGQSYRYHKTVVDANACVPDVWTDDYRNVVGPEPLLLFVFILFFLGPGASVAS